MQKKKSSYCFCGWYSWNKL